MSKPCIFFDRDGVVNQAPTTRYVERLEDFHILPGFIEALRIARERGYEAVIVTNQKGVASDRPPVHELERIHQHLIDVLAGEDLNLTDILYCAATDDDHPDRKPNPGMLLTAASRHHLDLARSWMIGDNEKDILAGQGAGCRTIFIGGQTLAAAPDFRIATVDDLPALLQRHLPDFA